MLYKIVTYKWNKYYSTCVIDKKGNLSHYHSLSNILFKPKYYKFSLKTTRYLKKEKFDLYLSKMPDDVKLKIEKANNDY